MKKSIALLIVATTIALAVPAFAELQNVVVGGEIRIRGNWFDFDQSNANTLTFAEERTRLSVRADFTDNVSAFIELDSYGDWGEGFRSNYLNGVDSRPAGNGVNVYQSYIEAKEMWGTALKARVGRMEIKLGSGWLIGTGAKAPYFYGLSFDGIRLTYATDQFSVDAIAAKLADQSPAFEDGDIDLYGLYGSYLGIENITLDAYALMIRDAKQVAGGALDTYTFGLRGAGTVGAIDFDAEGAYQLQDWDRPFAGAKDSSDSFAGTAEVGYTFDMTYTPRVFVSGAYFDGSDDDLPFNRLFSDVSYSKILDGGIFQSIGLTNIWTAAAGVSAVPTESVKLQVSAAYLSTVEDMGAGSNLGWEVDASAVYNYTQDLAIKGGYSRLIAGDLSDASGAVLVNGSGAGAIYRIEDINYFYLETKLSF